MQELAAALLALGPDVARVLVTPSWASGAAPGDEGGGSGLGGSRGSPPSPPQLFPQSIGGPPCGPGHEGQAGQLLHSITEACSSLQADLQQLREREQSSAALLAGLQHKLHRVFVSAHGRAKALEQQLEQYEQPGQAAAQASSPHHGRAQGSGEGSGAAQQLDRVLPAQLFKAMWKGVEEQLGKLLKLAMRVTAQHQLQAGAGGSRQGQAAAPLSGHPHPRASGAPEPADPGRCLALPAQHPQPAPSSHSHPAPSSSRPPLRPGATAAAAPATAAAAGAGALSDTSGDQGRAGLEGSAASGAVSVAQLEGRLQAVGQLAARLSHSLRAATLLCSPVAARCRAGEVTSPPRGCVRAAPVHPPSLPSTALGVGSASPGLAKPAAAAAGWGWQAGDGDAGVGMTSASCLPEQGSASALAHPGSLWQGSSGDYDHRSNRDLLSTEGNTRQPHTLTLQTAAGGPRQQQWGRQPSQAQGPPVSASTATAPAVSGPLSAALAAVQAERASASAAAPALPAAHTGQRQGRWQGPPSPRGSPQTQQSVPHTLPGQGASLPLSLTHRGQQHHTSSHSSHAEAWHSKGGGGAQGWKPAGVGEGRPRDDAAADMRLGHRAWHPHHHSSLPHQLQENQRPPFQHQQQQQQPFEGPNPAACQWGRQPAAPLPPDLTQHATSTSVTGVVTKSVTRGRASWGSGLSGLPSSSGEVATGVARASSGPDLADLHLLFGMRSAASSVAGSPGGYVGPG
ncbi:hypothetical protein V8C86DRAFT_2464305 [Haematococcus lacustris]